MWQNYSLIFLQTPMASNLVASESRQTLSSLLSAYMSEFYSRHMCLIVIPTGSLTLHWNDSFDHPLLPCPQPCLLRPGHMASKNSVRQHVLFMQIPNNYIIHTFRSIFSLCTHFSTVSSSISSPLHVPPTVCIAHTLSRMVSMSEKCFKLMFFSSSRIFFSVLWNKRHHFSGTRCLTPLTLRGKSIIQDHQELLKLNEVLARAFQC